MKLSLVLFAALGITAVSFGSLHAQQKTVAARQQLRDTPPSTPSAQSRDGQIFSSDVTRVPMLFTVTDKHGRFVTDLNRDDFEVF